MKRFFTAESAHGSSTSYGFSNDTVVKAFNSKKGRDKYVEESRNISCKAIRADQATKFAANWDMNRNKLNKPNPFDGEFWGIAKVWGKAPEGIIGKLDIFASDYDPELIERLYK